MLYVNNLYGFNNSKNKRKRLQYNITASTRNINVATYVSADGFDILDDSLEVLFTIDTDIVVGSESTSTAAFIIPTMHKNSLVKIINNGYIVGAGGQSPGMLNGTLYAGGDAISANHETIITNNGIIGGGGGSGKTHVYNNGYRFGGAGGGGAGDIPGASSRTYYYYGNGWGGGNGGAAGTLLTGGAGGGPANDNGGGTAAGGDGGDLGQPGNGVNNSIGGGAAAGNAINGGAYVTLSTYGDIRGNII